MAGQLRMRMVTMLSLRASSARFTTIRTGQASSTYCKERSLIIEMESLPTMGREWAGQRAEHHTLARERGTIPAVEISVDIVRQE